MKRILVCFVIFLGVVILWSETIFVPEDNDSIQSAIGVAVDGDEIIVAPGTYNENIDFDGKAIILGSLFYTTQDTSYIAQTVIDGCQSGRVVTFSNGETENSVLWGFTITNGLTNHNGGGIFCGDNCSPTLTYLKIINNQAEDMGGGFYCGENSNPVMSELLVAGNSAYDGAGGAYDYYCDLIMEDSVIRDNISENYGGGIYTSNNNLNFEDMVVENNTARCGGGFFFNGWQGLIDLKDVFIQNNQATERGGGIFTYVSLYLENVTITNNSSVDIGGGLYASWAVVEFAEEISKRCSIYLNECESNQGRDIYSNHTDQDVILSAFSVLYPSSIYTAPINRFTFDIEFGVVQQIDGDIYVSPEGDDSNSGLCTGEAFKTIQHAVSQIMPTNESFHTIYLGEGTYSASTTGEIFPVYLPDGVHLCGESLDTVILDGEDISQVIYIENVTNITISGVTVTNGYAEYEGGGIYCLESNVILEDMRIKNNSSGFEGGGIYSEHSDIILDNLIILNNTSDCYGGGIYIAENIRSLLKNLTIAGNVSDDEGGGLYLFGNILPIINCIFRDNSPYEIHAASFPADTLIIVYSAIQDGIAGINSIGYELNWLEGNIDADPLFIDATNGNYNLQEDSPCIDAGVAYFEYEEEVLIDLQDDDYWGIAPDMGACEYMVIENDESVIENGKLKMENYPNPFNPETTIAFNLPDDCDVELGIYNLRGQRIRELKIKEERLKIQEVVWDGRNDSGSQVASGVYVVRLQAGNDIYLRKIVMVK